MKYIKISFIFLIACMFTACSSKNTEDTLFETKENWIKTSEYESDGMKYMVCEGEKLKITYPVIDYNYIDDELIGTYDIGNFGAGRFPQKGDDTYIISAIIEWPTMYEDKEISSISVNVYNSPFCIESYTYDEMKYAKETLDIFSSQKDNLSTDKQAIKLITFAEVPTTEDIWNDYMQSQSEEIEQLSNNIKNAILAFHVKDNDGNETIDYYRMELAYEYSVRKINIYKIRG